MCSLEQFQSLIQQMSWNEEADTNLCDRIVHDFLTEHLDEVNQLDQSTILLLQGLLTVLCKLVNAEFARVQAEANETGEDGRKCYALLEEVAEKLRGVEAENMELREQLQELLGEMNLRQGELAEELESYKEEAEGSRAALEESRSHQSLLEQLFRQYEIKLGEAEQQKLLAEQGLAREEGRRRLLEGKLHEVQGQLQQLSLKFQSLERSHDEVSQSLESREDRIRQLNRIIEESEYLSSLSPHSHNRIELEQDNSYASQQLARALDEHPPLLRLSQSELPAEQSLGSISAVSIEEQPKIQLLPVPKSERALVASESKPKKGSKAVLHSHQKKPSKEEVSLRKDPEKAKTNRQEAKTVALSKQDSRTVRSKLTSIFRDRLQYRADHDQAHEERINFLKDRLRERQEEIESLQRQVSVLKVVRAEPVVVSSGSKEGRREVHVLRAENESLRRITKEIALRKEYLEAEVEELKDKCAYYKAEHRNIYEKFLLKNAESAAYSEQLSELSHLREESQREGQEMVLEQGQEVPGEEVPGEQRDEFEDLSLKFNNLVLKHSHAAFNELQEPSFKSGEGRDFYTVQNIHLADSVSDNNDRTLEHDRRLPLKNAHLDPHSPAKAVINEDARIEDLILEGIEEIALRENPNQEIQTERLILSQLMQTSRRENSLSAFQILFSEHPAKLLQMVTLGCLAQHAPRQKTMSLFFAQPIVILPLKPSLAITLLEEVIVLPRERVSVSVGNHFSCETQQVQTETAILVDSSCEVAPETGEFSQMWTPCQQEASTETSIQCQEGYANTDVVCMSDAEASCQRPQTQDTLTGMESIKVFQCSVSTDQTFFYELSVQTDGPCSNDACISTEMGGVEQQTNTNTVEIQNSLVQTFIRPFSFAKFDIAHIQPEQFTLQLTTPFSIAQIRSLVQKYDQSTYTDLILTHQSTNTDAQTTQDVSINCDPKHLQFSRTSSAVTIHPTVLLPTLSLISQTVQEKITKNGKLHLNLSFLSNHQSEVDEQKAIAQRSAVKPWSSAGLQLSSCRTRSSSQDIHSSRSGKSEKSDLPRPHRQTIRESMISERSEASDENQKNEQPSSKEIQQGLTENCKTGLDFTAEHTPETQKESDSLTVSRMVEAHDSPAEIHPEATAYQREPLSESELSEVRDYFYRLNGFDLSLAMDVTEQQSLSSYDFEANMYVVHAVKNGQLSKFVCCGGRIMHFGREVERMELITPGNRKFKSSATLGNCQFRMFSNKVQVSRALKRRCFRGEMENGEWEARRVWVYAVY